MEGASPARLYATLIGGALVVFGIFGVFAVNGWHNLLHLLTGGVGLLVAGYAARGYALALGALYAGLAVWGFVVGDASILGFIPVDTADNLLHLALGALGIGAGLSTPVARRERQPAAT
jgi:hypothetical protein